MYGREIAIGTCDGTGAVINVCLGFIPRYVKVQNIEGADFAVIEWYRSMRGIATIDEGLKTRGADDTDFDRAVLAATGISEYAGGDEVTYDGATHSRWEDSSGNDVSEKYVDGFYERTAAANAAYRNAATRLLGRTPGATDDGLKLKMPPGFVIAADTDLNVDGEQLVWIAIK